MLAHQHPAQLDQSLGRIPASGDDARHLIATLLAEGTPDALSAAAQLSIRCGRDLYAIALTRVERTAVLACLEDPGMPSIRRGCC